MREIKFRFYSQHNETGKISVRENTLEEIEDQDSWQGYSPWKRLDVCQYIGPKDKNGVEVFKKDILGGLLSGGYIDKCDKCYSFQYFLKDFGCMNCLGDVCWSEVVESILDGESWVIGNMYQNPELLNQIHSIKILNIAKG